MANNESLSEDGALSTKSKADLLVLIGERNQAIEDLTSSLRDADERASMARGPAPDPEAVALADCLGALKKFQQSTRGNSGGYSTSYELGMGVSSHEMSRSPVERVLRHLADAFGVPLIRTQTEPCSRTHLDQIQPEALVHALATAGERMAGF